MRSFLDAKLMAKSLRDSLQDKGITISHGNSLEIVAQQFGFKDWNVLSAKVTAEQSGSSVRIQPAIPVFRMFDEAKAREFYVDYLGFSWDWEHRFHDNSPLYCQISRSDFRLHLSEHHGDASPGATAWVQLLGVDQYLAELRTRKYSFMNPGIEGMPWGREMEVIDPFGNRIRFCEQAE